MMRVTAGCGSYDRKVLTKISPLIGGMDILDFGRESKKYRIYVLDILDYGEKAFSERFWSKESFRTISDHARQSLLEGLADCLIRTV